jgi:hypothetical protein
MRLHKYPEYKGGAGPISGVSLCRTRSIELEEGSAAGA